MHDAPKRVVGFVTFSFKLLSFVQVKRQFQLDKVRLTGIANALIEQMQSGLTKGSDSSMKMLPSHLTAQATGAEVGKFLALDLGGTNFRVLKVREPMHMLGLCVHRSGGSHG